MVYIISGYFTQTEEVLDLTEYPFVGLFYSVMPGAPLKGRLLDWWGFAELSDVKMAGRELTFSKKYLGKLYTLVYSLNLNEEGEFFEGKWQMFYTDLIEPVVEGMAVCELQEIPEKLLMRIRELNSI